MPKIFISYRHEDSPDEAVPIRDRLALDFGKDDVFFDDNSIRLSHNFRTAMSEKVGASVVRKRRVQSASVISAYARRRVRGCGGHAPLVGRKRDEVRREPVAPKSRAEGKGETDSCASTLGAIEIPLVLSFPLLPGTRRKG
jgi:hypothetical protein